MNFIKWPQELNQFCILNNEHRIVDSGVVPVSLSDHFLIFSVLKVGVTKAPPRTIEYRSYKHFDINAFKRDLESVPWHVIENEDNIDDAVCIWNKLFSDIADSHVTVIKTLRIFVVLASLLLQFFINLKFLTPSMIYL